jgi:hypothetical protein
MQIRPRHFRVGEFCVALTSSHAFRNIISPVRRLVRSNLIPYYIASA